MNSDIISLIGNNNNYSIKQKITRLIEYLIYEKNYYNILHNNKNKDFGTYIHLAALDNKEKAEKIYDALSEYLKEYKILSISIDDNKIFIALHFQGVDYDNIVFALT